MIRRPRRTASAALAVATLALLAPTTAALAAETTDDPVEAAAGWLATQLVDGERMEATFGGDTFPDQGLTADVVLALAGAQVAGDEIAAATDWLEDQTGAYTGTAGGDVFAGAVAKLLVVAETTDRDPTDFGGEDLVALLAGQEDEDGRFADDSGFGDFSNTFSQSLAVVGLERTAGTDPSDDAIAFLVDQACEDGGFPEQLEPEECTSQVDATAFAIQAALAVGEAAVADDAAAWLLEEQAEDGSFVGDVPANANSTGLAALALSAVGEDEAAGDARDFVLSLQAGCDDEEPGSIRFDADDSGERPRATAQALPGLTGAGLATVTAAGADTAAPLLACPEEVDDGPDDDGPEDDGPDPSGDDTDATDGDDETTGDDTASPDVVTADVEQEDELPATGDHAWKLAALAAALLGAGALALRLGRARP